MNSLELTSTESAGSSAVVGGPWYELGTSIGIVVSTVRDVVVTRIVIRVLSGYR